MIYADLILKNGNIITIDSLDTITEAVASKFGTIIAVGTNLEIEEYNGKGTIEIDLSGKTLIPGLIDSHGHFMSEGANREINIDLSEEAGIKSISDIQTVMKEKTRGIPDGEWIFGYQEDDSKLKEMRHPTKWELDDISDKHPILISTVGGHFYMANSKAFELAGVTKETPDPIGGKFDRDPESKEINGGVHETAYTVLLPEGPPQPTRKQSYDGARNILNECAAHGLTCVYDLVYKSEIRAAIDLKNAGELPIRVRMDISVDIFETLEKLGIYRGLGDDHLKICGTKFFFDGAISARTAAVSEPYLDKPGFYGVMATTEEIANKILNEMYSKGYRVSCHANGDTAIEMYLNIMENIQKKYPRIDSRNRDIHCTVLNDKLISRIKELNILPTIFGAYCYYHGDKLIPAFGEDRLENMFAARSLLDAGIKVAAHSDHPCSPFPPLMAIHALVNRTTKKGRAIGQTQKISVLEALKLYTINAAYHSFDENILGSIEVGKKADFVILGEDILSIQPEKIIDIPILMTIINGKIIYQK